MMHGEVVVQTFWKSFYTANVFQEFWTFVKFAYFWFTTIYDQLYQEENDKNDHNPENDAHIVKKREKIVSD